MNQNNQLLVSTGRLQVSTTLSDAGRPISGAVVRITPKDERQNVLAELITNVSGKTEIISLPSPPIELSLRPESPRPYSLYDVTVNAPGFKPAVINGVQILPDTTAFQNINLFPDIAAGTPIESIDIYPHTLYAEFPPKIPEDPVKPLPESLGFVVLPQVVIPEFVIVHAGDPTDTAAPNYWVPFASYIKNVASCEIYSTWPANTITANVLAIISFTLNRVYTEWYRNKGFPFTITSSTAYDQAFSYGRNIYENISTIVNDIFTNFITKPGIRQPLFTQYCNGSNVTCPGWLSQWGSKSLGEEGLGPVDILRYYYGNDIFLMSAEKVAGVPVSYPGAPLSEGSTGENVRTIQTQLNAISNNYPAIPKLRVDGIFGANTKMAVETFQQIFNLPVTGIVDQGTWYEISNIYVAVAKLAEL